MGVGCGQEFYGVYARLTALEGWLESIPGIPDGDARDATHGPGDLAAPSATGTAAGYTAINLHITPAASGATPTAYTIWLRQGVPAAAQDIHDVEGLRAVGSALAGG